MAFLHMHHAMANKALAMVGSEAQTSADFWNPNKSRIREIVLSGAVDYKDRWWPVVVTDEDRLIKHFQSQSVESV